MRATKLCLADQEGPDFARALNAAEKGTFMEQWESRIEKIKKSSSSRKREADSYLDNVELMSSVKRQKKIIRCFNCQKEGHKSTQCTEPRKKQENHRVQQQIP